MTRKILALVALASLALSAQAQSVYPRFGPVDGVLKGDADTFQTSAALSTDIISLWSGTCNATTFLRGDGSCQATGGGGSSAGNPTALVGLTAINGVASTLMRSDGAPALNQAISPTWTGTHIFSNAITVNGISSSNWANTALANLYSLSSNTATGQSFTNTSTGTSAQNALTIANSTNSLRAGISSTAFSGSALTSGPTGQSAFLTTNAAVPLTLGTNNTARVTFGTAGDWSVGGGVGTSGQVLTSAGAGATPTWTTVAGGGGATGANPTALVGLTAVNGASGSFIRADGAPALSQAIAPTWTSPHIFADRVQATGFVGTPAEPNVQITSTSPYFGMFESDATANNRSWVWRPIADQLRLSACNDTGSTCTDWALVDRTGTTLDSVNLTASSVQVNGQDVRNAALFNAGTLPVARGGTGTTTSTGSGSVVLSAAPTLTGTVTAGTFSGAHSGDGSGLTNLDAADIGAGTLPVARGGTSTTTSTGSGSVVLSGSPTITGVLAASTINASAVAASSSMTVGGSNVCLESGANCPSGSGSQYAAIAVSGGACSISASGASSGVSSCTYNSAGSYSLVLSTASATRFPTCTVTSTENTGIRVPRVGLASANTVQVTLFSLTSVSPVIQWTATDGSFHIHCYDPQT